jgi:hypothetical protein
MTDTVRIAYRWCQRNGIGEPVPVVRYTLRVWDDPMESPPDAPTPASAPAIAIPEHSYPLRDVLSPGPNEISNPWNPLAIAAIVAALEILAGLIWMVMR